MANERNSFIDLLKGICIIFVVFTHAQWTDEQMKMLLFPFWIDMAVPFFMLVTGYVYTKSFQKNGIDSLDLAYNKKYMLRHFIRYTIPYIMMFSIDFSLNLILSIKQQWGIKKFFLHNAAIFFQGGIGPGSYYYPEMLQIIFIFPFIYILVKRYNFTGVLITAGVTFFFEILKIPYFVNEELYRLLLFRYFMLLGFGAYFASNQMQRKMWMLAVIGTLFILLFGYTGYKPFIFRWWTGTSMLPVLFIIPIFGLLVEKNINFKPLEIVGKASYNIFLVQMVYFWVLYGRVCKTVPNIFGNALASIFICVLVGLLFYEIENRITQRILRVVS